MIKNIEKALLLWIFSIRTSKPSWNFEYFQHDDDLGWFSLLVSRVQYKLCDIQYCSLSMVDQSHKHVDLSDYLSCNCMWSRYWRDHLWRISLAHIQCRLISHWPSLWNVPLMLWENKMELDLDVWILSKFELTQSLQSNL